MTTIWKCSEDPTDITQELTGQVSPSRNVLQLCRWANGRVGAIVPLYDTPMLYFTEVVPDSARHDPQLDFEPAYDDEIDNSDLDSHIVSRGGIVARWLLDRRGLHPFSHGFAIWNDSNFRKNILHTLKENPYFDTLYETHLEAAREEARRIFESTQEERRKKLGAWKPENKEFKFSLEKHLKEERIMNEYDELHLYPFFRQEDVDFMRAIVQDYREYIQHLIRTSSTDVQTSSTEQEEKNPKEKKPKDEKPFVPTKDTFKIEHTTVERLQQVFQQCMDHKWLGEYTRVEDWLKLFTGVPSEVRMVWKYEERPALRDLFKMMAYDKDGEQKSFISPRKGYLTIVSSHFVSEEPTPNKPYAYITNFECRHRKGDESAIEMCRRVLNGEEIDTIVFEMIEKHKKLQAQKESEAQNRKSIIGEASPDNVTINKANAAWQAGQRVPSETIRSTKIK